jgi:hypothetical protein
MTETAAGSTAAACLELSMSGVDRSKQAYQPRPQLSRSERVEMNVVATEKGLALVTRL